MLRTLILASVGLGACITFLDTSPIDRPDVVATDTAGDSDTIDVTADSDAVEADAEPDVPTDTEPDVPTDVGSDAESDGDTAPPPTGDPCVASDPWCDDLGALLVRCDTVPFIENCTFGCEDGACRPTCAQETGCSVDGTAVIECFGESPEVDELCPDGFACVGARCRGNGDCVPGSSRCNVAGDLVLCDETGAEEVIVSCPGATCGTVWLDHDEDGWGNGAAGARYACSDTEITAPNGDDCDDNIATDETSPCPGFSLISAGEFRMGTPSGEIEPIPELESREQLVAFDRSLLVMQTEVTQELWVERAGTVTNPAFHADCPTCPVERVNWFEALTFSNRMSESEALEPCYSMSECSGSFGGGCEDGDQFCGGGYVCDRVEFSGLNCPGYRLPTEAEWEYFARAGSAGPFSGRPSDLAWYRETVTDGASQTARGLAANAWGIHDVHGNVAEWVMDLATEPHQGGLEDATLNPLLFGSATDVSELRARVTRGGGFVSTENACRSGSRGVSLPQDRVFSVGLRLVRTHFVIGQ